MRLSGAALMSVDRVAATEGCLVTVREAAASTAVAELAVEATTAYALRLTRTIDQEIDLPLHFLLSMEKKLY